MFAAVYVPDFSLQAVLRHEPELHSQPVGLIDSQLIAIAGENSIVAGTAGAADVPDTI